VTVEEPGVPAHDGAELREDLDSDRMAAGSARQVVRAGVQRWHLPSLVDSLLLAVTELVTNAVRYGRAPVILTLRRTAGELSVRVHDANPTEPVMNPEGSDDPDAESGRGMHIVSALADRTGCEQVDGDGKVVFAAFRTPPSVDS
jgi:anti-sigma regulatory factor (Ser/Thr protein kinase)